MGTVAAAEAVLDALVIALREYEIGPHAAIRLVRALAAVDEALVTDLLPGLDPDDDRLSQVPPEDLADVLAVVRANLQVRPEDVR